MRLVWTRLPVRESVKKVSRELTGPFRRNSGLQKPVLTSVRVSRKGNMVAKRRSESLENLIWEILATTEAADAKTPGLRTLHSFYSLAGRDYSNAVRKLFDRRQVAEILAEMCASLPGLNQRVFQTVDLRGLTRIAAELGAVLKAKPLDDSRGRALRGFYVGDRVLVGKPLIYVNTADHPVRVAAAFWHEVGHHLVKRIFDSRRAQTRLSLSPVYQTHLDDPEEIVADMLLVLACYPHHAALRLFDSAASTKPLNQEPGRLVARARPYIRAVSGWDFEKKRTAAENLERLTGMIHFAKLRATLLSDFEI
jgi:hypothetical protein